MPTPLPDDLARRLDGLKAVGDQWIARCPTHPDSNPSLTVRVADTGKILVHCHANCDPLAILAALGLDTPADTSTWTPLGDAVAVYDYRDEQGRLLFQVLRTADKQFRQRRPDPGAKSGWRWLLGDVRRVPYRLPELLEAIAAGKSVVIVEGEKDVDALTQHGKVATTNPGGAGKWRPEYAEFFREAQVTIVADKDRPGQAHARAVAASLAGIAAKVWIVEAADPHKDIAAHLGAGLPFSAVVVTTVPEAPVEPDLAPTVLEILDSPEPDYQWLVPGLLERGDRVMLTGFEGLGKSMWLRMLAVCLAAGINPVTFAPITPLDVLMIDCENSLRQSRRAFRPMVEQAGKDRRAQPVKRLRLIHRPNGINLPDPDDAAWLLERVVAHQPQVLIVGPLYRLHLDNPNDESTARRVVAAVDAARTAVDCAVLIEAHAGHGDFGPGKNRSMRPTGSSLYLRWPEFGLGMRPVFGEKDVADPNFVELGQWRGPRDERNWPEVLHRAGNGWPWEPSDWQMQRALA